MNDIANIQKEAYALGRLSVQTELLLYCTKYAEVLPVGVLKTLCALANKADAIPAEHPVDKDLL